MDGVRLDALGRIESGHDQGRYIIVQSPQVNQTSGFQILLNAQPDMAGEGGDYWVESQDDLVAFMSESNWVIEWLEPDGTRR